MIEKTGLYIWFTYMGGGKLLIQDRPFSTATHIGEIVKVRELPTSESEEG